MSALDFDDADFKHWTTLQSTFFRYRG